MNNSRHSRNWIKSLSLCFIGLLLLGLALNLEPLPVAQAATFNIADGDVYGPNGLIAAINTANGNGQTNVINLAPYSNYPLASVDNNLSGSTGLPAISGTLVINGNGSIIQRQTGPSSSSLRIFHITSTGNFTLNNLTVQHGRQANGGAIYNQAGILTINNSNVIANDGTKGGAINNSGGTLTITNSTIAANTTISGDGGGIYNFNGNATIFNSTVYLNSGIQGGGIFNGSSIGGNPTTLKVINSTITRNNARDNTQLVPPNSYGGGIFNGGGDATTTLIVINSTISDNYAATNGGGIYTMGNAPSLTTTTLSNTLVVNNGYNCVAGTNGTYNPGSNNLEFPGPTTCGTGSSVAPSNPLSSAGLANNGGPTLTIALASGSTAIDTGNNTICADPNTVNNLDQRGFSRSQGPACDIGAYEEAICTALTVSSSLDNGACGTLRYAVSSAINNSVISFNLSSLPATIKLSGSGLNIPTGITITGSCNPSSKKPDIIIDGTGIGSDGLTLNGNTTLSSLQIKGFAGRQIHALKGGNTLKCIATSKT